MVKKRAGRNERYFEMTHHFDSGFRSRKKKPKLQAFLAVLICLLAVGGFFWKSGAIRQNQVETMLHPKVTDKRSEEQAREDFDKQLQKIFEEEVTDDTLTLNYTLKRPEDYGISEKEPTLGSFSLEGLRESLIVSENRIAMLETFDFEKLNTEQQLLYDIIYKMSKQNLTAADFLEYSEVLSPTSGIQAQLPVFFAEYHFYQKEDVEKYIALLEKVPDYFRDILTFEKAKSKKGIFMSDITAQAIIEQCEDFIKEPEKNYMISVFQKKLSELHEASEKEKKEWMKKNETAVKKSVIPAYKELIKGLKALKGTG
ncbi:MAG: DUF885 family protein, partial [Lachnospiraceae bacterium]|nr:DUF885 family protein [Lachnospiraceae bacterium]